MDKLPMIAQQGSIGLMDGHGITSNFNRNVSGISDPDRLQPQVLISPLAVLPKEPLDRPRTLYGFAIGRHVETVGSKQSGKLIVVSGIKRSAVVLGETTDNGFYIQ